MHQLYALLSFILFSVPLFAQNTREAHQNTYSMNAVPAQAALKIDGTLDEASWQNAPIASGFTMKWPRDGGPAPAQTEVRCVYDDHFLYIGILARDSSPEYVTQSLKRDNGYWDSDGVAVILDPNNVAANGYFFGVSAKGVQTDALIATGSDDMDTNWDNTWWVETRSFPGYFTAEYAIPLRILRFKEGKNTWGINIVRNDLSNGIYSTWAVVPFQFDGIDLGWTGALHWQTPPKRAKGNYNLAPYIGAGIQKNYEDNTPLDKNLNAGLDAKIGIGTGLNLDVTVNPDFSQIEIDEQVVNLTRFNVQLPEKRTFFLENADVFGNFGIPPIRPFFSRRIGLNDDGTPGTILGGLRLTGNLGPDTRVGALMMQTRPEKGSITQNYSALTLTRRIFGRSTVGGYMLNRESFDKAEHTPGQYRRNAGLETLFISTDGKWNGWLTHHRSFQPEATTKNWWGNTGFTYSTRKFNILVDALHTGENYEADMGFETRIRNYDVLRDTTVRIGYNFVFVESKYRIFFNNTSSRLNFIEIGASNFQVLNPDGSLNESSNNFGAEWNFKNTSTIKLSLNPNYAHVPVSFKFDEETDLTACPPLPAGEYRFINGNASWSSDYRQRLFVSVNAQTGGFYNGQIHTAGFEMVWRIKTLVNLRMAAAWNRLNFPEPYCDVDFFNLTPRIEVFFAKNVWWTTFIQYNNQADNFNINSRFQWRFRPMSDLFVVYTDNYGVDVPGVKNRALVAKMSYWF